MTNTSKIILVTGVSKGLGDAIVRKFKSEGHVVVGTSRTPSEAPLDHWIQADLTKAEDRQRVLAETLAKFGRLDVLVNNAGVGCYETWEKLDEEDMRRAFELNVFSLVLLTQACLQELLKTRGSVVNISSVAGQLYVPCMGPYCATKAAVTFFSNSLRAEMQHRGLHVLNMVVGRINTGFSSRSLGGCRPPSTPGGGKPEDLANALYKGWAKKKRSVTYPGWNRWVVPLLLGPLNWLYERENRKRWGL